MTNRTDDFNRGDSALSLGTPSDLGSGYTVTPTSIWGISSFAGYEVAGTGEDQAVLDSGTSAVEMQITLTTSTGTGTGVITRWADSSNWIGGIWDDNSTLTLYKRVAGSYTVIQSTGSLTYAANDVIKLRSDSANLHTLSQNGVSRCSGTDAAGSTNTKHGIRCDNSTNRRYDSLSITDIAAGGSSNRIRFPAQLSGMGVGGQLGGNRIN